jgi:DNA topoisomerase-1
MKDKAAPQKTDDRAEAIIAAKQACLRYVTDNVPGIERVRAGKHFRYRNPRGRIVTDPRTLARIRKLAVPPAWTEVWICPNPNGHLQATGKDARGRKQYRYHARWRAVRDENKFDKVIGFARTLPRIRRCVRRDLKLAGMPREKVLATIVRLLETTLIRIGNDEYARTNHSYGLTTLRNPHAHVRKDDIQFEFRGKSGVKHSVTVHDRRVARIVKRCQEIPGQELFQYLDEHGKRHAVDSADVNIYLQTVSGGDYTAKDFRTWAATLLAARIFQRPPEGSSNESEKANLVRCIEFVARQLGNTVAVCRKCYIHPGLVEAYLDGSLKIDLAQPAGRRISVRASEEAALLRWLRNQKPKLKRPEGHA